MSPPEALERARRRAFAVAYRMLGSVSEAEDVAQEALLRLHREIEQGTRIESPAAYVATVATRLALDELRSARARREEYVGEWLPEPIVTREEDDPAAHAELTDSLSFAFLRLLETLTPEQRAVLLLRDVFDYPYDRVAEILGKSEAAVRQLGARARGHVEAGNPRFETTREQRDRLADEFFAALEDGDLAGLERLLAGDVELRGDGGGKVPALARVLSGRNRVARTLINWRRVGDRGGGVTIERVMVNGQPGALVRDPAGRLINVTALDMAGCRIQAVSAIVNPDKLERLGPVADLRAFLRGEQGGS